MYPEDEQAGATLGVNTAIAVDFSEPIDPASVTSASFVLRQQGVGSPLAGTYSYADGNTRAVFQPAVALSYATGYEYEVTAGVTDADGNPLANPGTVPFMTSSAPPLALSAIQAPAARVGYPVVLSGTGFGTTPDESKVLFGSVETTPLFGDPGARHVLVPLGAESGSVRVAVGADTSNAVPFTVLPPPSLPVNELLGTATVPASGAPETPTLASLCTALAAHPQPEDSRIVAAALSYEHSRREEFGVEHDHFRLVGQDNVRRYLPVGAVRVRVHADDTAFDVFARACAAHVAGCRVVVSTPPGLELAAVARLEKVTESWAGAIEFVEESDAHLDVAIEGGQVDRVRYAAPQRAALAVLRAGNAANGCIVSVPVSAEGRLELLWYLREQSISTDYHRYGNLGIRADEPRAEVP